MPWVQTVSIHFEASGLASDALRVTAVRGGESLSGGFAFGLLVEEESGEGALTAEQLLGTSGRLTFVPSEGGSREVHGYTGRVERLPGAGRRFQLGFVPRFWTLSLTQRSRIFQWLSVPQIVAQVLQEGGVEHRLSLRATYPKREYCVQYRESDFDFVSRLLEEEGIYFFFAPPDGLTLVLADESPRAESVPGGAKVPFRPILGGVPAKDAVFSFSSEHRVRPGAFVHRDFSYLRPRLDLTSKASAAGGAADLEVYDYPSRTEDLSHGKTLAGVRLAELRNAAETFVGEGTCARFVPGFVFELEDHPQEAFNARYLVTRVQHSGSADSYRNRFVCQRADVAFRPARVTPRPSIPGIQTALVTGAPGEEIHTDAHGRVKVHFHWDREGAADDQSSCWVRVAQASAGAGFGGLHLPRVGQEVVLRFLEGDPDRPILIGSTYNGANPPPLDLPAQKTQSTLRSASTPGSGGSNELRFEDAAGAEHLFLHAQKDELLQTGSNKAQAVNHRESLAVTGDRAREVGRDQTHTVVMNDAALMEGSQRLTVLKDRKVDVLGALAEGVGRVQTVSVGAASELTVGAASSETVGAAKALTVGGAYAVNVGLGLNIAVGGLRLEQVALSRKELIGGSRDEVVGKNLSVTLGGEQTVDVAGTFQLGVEANASEAVGGATHVAVKEASVWLGKTFELKADSLSIEVGGKELLVSKSGNLQVQGKSITLDGSKLVLKGSTIKKVSPASGGSGQGEDPKKAEAPEKKDPPEMKSVDFSVLKVLPAQPVSLNVEVANVPDGAKAELALFNAYSGDQVKGGALKNLKVQGGKIVDPKTGKAPEFTFTAQNLPYDPYDAPNFFLKAQVPEKGLSGESQVAPAAKTLRVEYLHSVVSDAIADSPKGGSLTTQAEMREIAGFLGSRPHHRVKTTAFNASNVSRSQWGNALKDVYTYHQASHGNTDALTSLVCLGNTRFTETDVRAVAEVPSVPRYLVYMNACRAGWEPSLGNAFLARGTMFYIGFQISIPDDDARLMARMFYQRWVLAHCDPSYIPFIFDSLQARFEQSMRPMLLGGGRTLNRPVIAAMKAVGKAISSINQSIASLFR